MHREGEGVLGAAQGRVAEGVGGIPLREIGRRQHERQQRHGQNAISTGRQRCFATKCCNGSDSGLEFCVDKVRESASVARGVRGKPADAKQAGEYCGA